MGYEFLILFDSRTEGSSYFKSERELAEYQERMKHERYAIHVQK